MELHFYLLVLEQLLLINLIAESVDVMRKNKGYINIFQAAYILIVIGTGIWFQNLFKESSLWTSIILFMVGGIGAVLVICLIL